MSNSIKVIVDPFAPETAQEISRVLKEAGFDFELLREPAHCSHAPACRWINPESVNEEGRLAGAVLDAINTIEDTRHAFKSRQLGGLRKRLQQVLDGLPDE